MGNFVNKIALELGYSKALFIGKDDKYEYYSLVMDDDNTRAYADRTTCNSSR